MKIPQPEVKHSSTPEIEKLGEAISQIDYLINEGMIFNSADLKTLMLWGEQLQLMASSANVK